MNRRQSIGVLLSALVAVLYPRKADELTAQSDPRFELCVVIGDEVQTLHEIDDKPRHVGIVRRWAVNQPGSNKPLVINGQVVIVEHGLLPKHPVEGVS